MLYSAHPYVIGVDVIGTWNASIAVAQHHSSVINYREQKETRFSRQDYQKLVYCILVVRIQ